MPSRNRVLLFVSVFLLLLAACTMPAEPTPIPPFELPERPTMEDGALIDSVIVVSEGVDLERYAVEIVGHLRDGCTEIDSVTQRIDGDRIIVTVRTVRDADAICTMALVPFVHVEPLDVDGLEPGEYTVAVNGVTATLELDEIVDDEIDDDEIVDDEIDDDDAIVDDGIVDDGMVGQDALIESVRVLSEATPPAPYAIEIQGFYRDGCAALYSVTQTVDEEQIIVTVNTIRDPELMCTLALVPFTHRVPLNIMGLEAGEYTVVVDELETTLTLSDEDVVPIARGRYGISQEAMVMRQAMVEEIEVLILESYPVQINVRIQGYLGDGCTELSGIDQTVDGDRIYLTVYTERPVGAICTLVLVGFEETVSLDLSELEAGEYTIVVHDLMEELVLDEGMLGTN